MANPGFTFKELMKKPNLESVFKFLGDNPNSAILVACLIAAFKGVFRPIFTMMDKKSDQETKKYAAIREGLTELIAIPVYIAVPLVLGKSIVNTFYKNASKVTQKAVSANVKFIAVLASTAIIPAVCNVLQPPIMDAYKKRQESKTVLAKNNVPGVVAVNKPSFSGRNPLLTRISSKINSGMRIGS